MTIKMPEIIYDPIWNGHSALADPDGIIFHNDYGAMTAKEYRAWLLRQRVPTSSEAQKATKGFAHEYNDRNTIAQYIKEGRAGWHAGDGLGNGNMRYYGIEIVESYDEQYTKVSDADFIENENMTFRRAAELFHRWGKKPDTTTVRLHKQFSSTSCPHRSWKLHGKSVSAVQGYFIKQIAYYMSLGKTIKEIIDAENGGKTITVPATKPLETKPSTSKIEKKYAEIGTFYPDRTLQVYDQPSTSGKKLVQYFAKESVTYHTVHIGNGHVWIEYTRANGGRGYLPIRTYSNGSYGATWGVIPDDKAIAKPTSKIDKKYAEKGVFYPNKTVRVYNEPMEWGASVAEYYKGENVTYHTVIMGNGYVWLQYLRSNGQSGYIPCREHKNGKPQTLWGTIK